MEAMAEAGQVFLVPLFPLQIAQTVNKVQPHCLVKLLIVAGQRDGPGVISWNLFQIQNFLFQVIVKQLLHKIVHHNTPNKTVTKIYTVLLGLSMGRYVP